MRKNSRFDIAFSLSCFDNFSRILGLRFDNVRTQIIEEPDVRWHICSEPSALIGIGVNRIFPQGSNESLRECKFQLFCGFSLHVNWTLNFFLVEGTIASAAVNSDSVFVAIRSGQQSTIFAYKIAKNVLNRKWKEDLELPVDHLAVWRNSVIIIGGEKLEIYRETDFWMTATLHLTGNVRDFKIIEHQNYLLFAIALDEQISIYKLKNYASKSRVSRNSFICGKSFERNQNMSGKISQIFLN